MITNGERTFEPEQVVEVYRPRFTVLAWYDHMVDRGYGDDPDALRFGEFTERTRAEEVAAAVAGRANIRKVEIRETKRIC